VGQQPVFYYDLGSPQCYTVAEAIMSALPVVPEWEPVLGSDLGPAGSEPDRELIERIAGDLGLQPLRWPRPWPPETRRVMLAATYAKRVGRGVAFSLAAFRQAFAGGRDLGDEDTVLIAGAACEMHPVALVRGIELKSTENALNAAGGRARQAGVRSLPAIQVGNRTYVGAAALDHAVAALAPGSRPHDEPGSRPHDEPVSLDEPGSDRAPR
jgi:2-hydroxychromene-2-carboxylate isomerase